jgi:predicted phage gp36 major capsid-like protein
VTSIIANHRRARRVRVPDFLQRSRPHGDHTMTYDITGAAPEHKAAFALPREDYDELRNTFEEFKSANDERIARIERGRGDVLLEEKVDRINQALDAQQRRSQAGARRRERRCRVSPEI